ncbi:nuclear factor of activated T-cells, cytoplasmic 1 isoform X2 [Takifugu rubripes]|uniref:nuclear factor of activated T-cells, cytoplasmic 1 isoform X2 n=1 Tax=Takifugu rubripes TaxID=31033 RepID=UPI001145636B|nr:nuclear factor of activated T-cells, cytoplasmic 1-like isoform X2 [Takifugu rubripes]
MKSAEEEPHSYDNRDDVSTAGYYSSSNIHPNGAPSLESPRIEITAYGQFPEDTVEESSLPAAKRVDSIVTLMLPNADGYRDPSCLSPASSISSRSCHSDASSYESGFSYNYDNSPQNSPWQSPSVSPKGSTLVLPGDGCMSAGSPSQSPSTSPRASITDESWTGQHGSRPSSPCGAKRKYSINGGGVSHKSFPYSPGQSPGLSPQTSPRLSLTDETWLPNTNQYTNSAILAAINALTTDGMPDLGEGIPMKSRKTSQDPGSAVSLKIEPGGEELNPAELCVDEHPSHCLPMKKEGYSGGFLDVPLHPYSWSKPKQYVSPSLPALDWQLPSSSGPYSLQIQVQPKSHHRAHYETEGSRGAVKALAGGHPMVQLDGYMESEPLTLQLFIGTADDRLLRPHAFYQVHRITGKTVSTPSHEAMHNNTKVLEIPLLPENNMRAMIDCAGILKLRNSDIELRKGETDIGRKNTRVRMVFRVHINQATGRTVSLQVASNPIECSQRSAQELPLVEQQSLETCSASGGEKMLLQGHNFQHDSKVVFVEKAQDGQHLWEMEAKVVREASKSTSLLVEIPPYCNQRLSTPVHVNFYVCNGKRKRSQHQHFTFVPANVPTIKTEPHDDFDVPVVCSQHSPKPYFPPQVMSAMMTPDLRPYVVGPISQQIPTPKPSALTPLSSPSTSPQRQELSSFTPHVSIIQEAPGRYQPLSLNPPSSSAASPTSQASTPTNLALSSSHCTTVIDSSSPGAQTHPKGVGRRDSSPPSLAVSIKQEPQELDQMYLDDVNEIIRNDLSGVAPHQRVVAHQE